jgi:hypothetical protein
MSTLDRYKKKGGFVQILTLIETSEPAKSEKFLNIIAQESTVWAQAIKDKALSIEKIKTLGERVLAEALEELPPNVLATALVNQDPEGQNTILVCLSAGLRKKIENSLKESPEPRPGDIISCQLRVIGACRSAITDGRVKQSLLPKDLQIPEDIENQLAQAQLAQTIESVVQTPLNSTAHSTHPSSLAFAQDSSQNSPQGSGSLSGSSSNSSLSSASSLGSFSGSPSTSNSTSVTEPNSGRVSGSEFSPSHHQEVLELKKALQKLVEENQNLKNQLLENQNRFNQIKRILG